MADNKAWIESQAERIVEELEKSIEEGWQELIDLGLSHLITKEDYRARLIESLDHNTEEEETKLRNKFI